MTRAQWEHMRAHVESCEPLEGCGVLTGHGERVERVLPVANVALSSIRFRMDPKAQLKVFREIEEQGLEMVGIFHSHPLRAGDTSVAKEAPSATDVREAAYPVVHVIWSRRTNEWQARGFWIEGTQVSEVALLVTGAG